eukprot:356435-Chlamydomonas_euryale.AAC.2
MRDECDKLLWRVRDQATNTAMCAGSHTHLPSLLAAPARSSERRLALTAPPPFSPPAHALPGLPAVLGARARRVQRALRRREKERAITSRSRPSV